MNQYRKIGVIGGMGPETSAAFYKQIIALFQTGRGARHNHEFPEMLIHNVPSTDNVEVEVGSSLWPFLEHSVGVLERAGMDFLVIPCNSAHLYIQEVQALAKVPVLNILEETAIEIGKQGLTSVLVLGTKTTVGKGLYEPYLSARGISSIRPSLDDQNLITQVIMKVCDGSVGEKERQVMLQVISRYPQAQGVILGCTELPLALSRAHVSIPTFDTLEILAASTFAYCIEPALGS